MKLQWLGLGTDEGHASLLQEKEATLREELSKLISETKKETMEFCVFISVTKALRDFPKAFAAWVRDSMTLSNIDNLKKVYNETLKSVMEEHRGTVDQTLWPIFVERVENESGSICKLHLEQVHDAVTKFIASINQVFIDEDCFPCHAKLEEFGMGELKRICESLEENFVQPAVLQMCLEILSAFKVQNDRVHTAEKKYAKTIINAVLKEYNSEMGNYTSMGALRHAHSPCVFHAINSTLCDKFSQIFHESFPANKAGLREIHEEKLQELKVSLAQAFHKHEATNQKNLDKALHSVKKKFEKSNGDGKTKIVENTKPALEALQDEEWIVRYMHENSRLENSLECEIQLAIFKDDKMDPLQWRSLQASLELPLIFEEFQVKDRVTLEEKTEFTLDVTRKYFHGEMYRLIAESNSHSSSITFPLVHSTLVDKYTRGFQNLFSTYLDSANISSEVEKLRLELLNTLKMYQATFEAKYKEIKSELRKIVSNFRSEYAERMDLLFKQHSNGLSSIVLQNTHNATEIELKKLLEIELKKRFKFEDPEILWKSVKKFIDAELVENRKKTIL